MAFLSKKNTALLQEILQEEAIPLGYEALHKMAAEFAQKKGNRVSLPLMEMNKQFLLMIRLAFQQLQDTSANAPVVPALFSSATTNTTSTSNLPMRPQAARSKNVSFDEQLELHKTHFQQFAAPPPPTPPVFQDPEPTFDGDLHALMQKAMSERNYDAQPPPLQGNGRKLQIGSVIEDETHKQDLIDIEKFNQAQPSEPQQPPPPLSAVNFFAKLKTVPVQVASPPPPPPPPLTEGELDISDLTIHPMDVSPETPSSKRSIEILTDRVNQLTVQLEQLATEFAMFRKEKNNAEGRE